jgi:hypothetical protein
VAAEPVAVVVVDMVQVAVVANSNKEVPMSLDQYSPCQ